MIYTVGGIKGGSGKSTIAVNLTILLAKDGRDVLLVDADDQETSTDFTHWRNESTSDGVSYTAIQLSNEAVRTEVLKLKSKYDDVVIDTGGRDTTSQRAAIIISDVYLVPFIPRSFDIWTLEKVNRLVQEIKTVNANLRTYAFLNKADPRGTDNNEAEEFLSEVETLNYLDTPIGHRKAFANAASMGLSVVEYRPKDRKAIAEIESFYKRITTLE